MSQSGSLTIADVTLIPSQKMELDMGSLWTWTVPLWGLLVIVFFLVGVLSETVILKGLGTAIPAVMAGGGGGRKRQVRFSNA